MRCTQYVHFSITPRMRTETSGFFTIFTSSGKAAREFKHRVKAGMVGINIPIPVPMAFHSFGGWKASIFGDHYMHLADLTSYLRADKELNDLYADRDAWVRKAILNVASSGRFSSDRTITEYATEIWNVKPCPVQ